MCVQSLWMCVQSLWMSVQSLWIEILCLLNRDLQQEEKQFITYRKQFDLYGRIYPIRPERTEALSPGQRPGLLWTQGCRPVRAKALKLPGKYIKLLPLQGALPIAIIPRALPWAKSFCPLPFPSAGDRWFRACCWRASGSSGCANRTGRNILLYSSNYSLLFGEQSSCLWSRKNRVYANKENVCVSFFLKKND